MKKVLFATTALVAFAGAASAQGVALSGSAEMGIFGGDGIETQFHTDIDVTFTMSGETDNGLTFGASIDLDESDGSGMCDISDNDDIDAAMTINGETVDFGNVAGGVTEGGAFSDGDNDNAECTVMGYSPAFDADTQGGETIFLSGNFGTITMGDTDGAFDWALDEMLLAAGSIGDNEEHGGYNGLAGFDGTYDGQVLRYDYSISGFGVAVSAEVDDTGVGDPVWGIGFTYAFEFAGGDLDLGLGYQGRDDDEIVGISAIVSLDSGFSAGVNYTESEVAMVDGESLGIGLGYATDMFEVGFNYGTIEVGGVETEGYGLAAEYNLGGGAAVQFGYGHTDLPGTATDVNTWSFGVSMSF